MPEENKKPENEAWDTQIGGRKRNFVIYYCTDCDCFMNGTAAYKKAFKNCEDDNVAAASASRLLRNVKVKDACRKLLELAQAEIDIANTYKILKDLELFALYNPAEIIDVQGKLVVSDLKDLGEKAKCIAGIETRITKSGHEYTVIKLIDRNRSIESLSKYLNLIRPENPLHIQLPVIVAREKLDLSKWGIQEIVNNSEHAE